MQQRGDFGIGGPELHKKAGGDPAHHPPERLRQFVLAIQVVSRLIRSWRQPVATAYGTGALFPQRNFAEYS
jgi:hypothetical protein